MSKEVRKDYKKKLIIAKYEVLSLNAIVNELQSDITFRDWINYYGLYSTGKEVEANTTDLGEALLEVNVLTISDLEQELVDGGRKSIQKDLKAQGIEVENLNLKLN